MDPPVGYLGTVCMYVCMYVCIEDIDTMYVKARFRS